MTEKVAKELGQTIGANHKFATPNQRLSYKPDSYDNILEEFKLFLEENRAEYLRNRTMAARIQHRTATPITEQPNASSVSNQ